MALKKPEEKQKSGIRPISEKRDPKKPVFLHLAIKDKVMFARHMSVMLDAGIPLHEALGVLEEQITQPSLQYVLRVAIADLADGMPLHTSIAKFPKLFDAFFINAMSVGELSGTLSATMRNVASQLEKSEDLKGKVRSALVYPAIVFVGALGIGAYLAFYMLPKILPLFTTLKVKLPPTTRALLAFSSLLTHYWPYFIIGIIVLTVGTSLLLKLRAVRYFLQSIALPLPVVGELVRNIQTAKFASILGTLLQNGVTIVTALNVTARSTDNLVYEKEIDQIAASVERGETIGSELRLHPRLFSRTTTSMVGVGERTGKLSESLISLAEFTEREVDVSTRNLSTLIEPLTLMFVGLLVGFVALSIITPIYQITQGIHA